MKFVWAIAASWGCGARAQVEGLPDECPLEARWTRELVADVHLASVEGPGDQFPEAALVLDGDVPHAVYAEEGGALVYARRVGGVWETEALGVVTTFSPAIAIGPDGDPRIAYRTEGGELVVAVAPTWKSTTVSPAADGGLDLVVTPDGNVHACFSVVGERAVVEHAWNEGGEWRVETLADRGPADLGGTYVDCDLALDPVGGLHAVVTSPMYGPFGHARFGDGEWIVEDVPGGPTQAAIAVDSDRVAHVFFDPIHDQALRHAVRSPDGDWTTLEAGPSDGFLLSASAASGPAGFVQVAQPAGGIRWARWTTDTEVESDDVDGVDGDAGAASLGVDADGEPCILYNSAGGIFYSCRENVEDCSGA